MAAPYVDIETIARVADPAKPTGPLGGLGPLPVAHERRELDSDLEQYRFGLTDSDILRLLDGLTRYQVAVVIAGTGTGKSTFLPYRLMVPPAGAKLNLTARGPIVVTEPRVAATVDTAAFVGRVLHRADVGPGHDVGYQAEGEKVHDGACRLVYVTDGSLINWLRDGSFRRFSTIMVDEAHERSANIDFILGYLRAVLPRNPDLKLVIASATISAEFFVDFFGGEGHVFTLEADAVKDFGYGEPLWPLEDVPAHRDWLGRRGPAGEDLMQVTRSLASLRVVNTPVPIERWKSQMADLVVRQVVEISRGTRSGDILAFLPAVGYLDEAVGRIREALGPSADVYPFARTVAPDIQRRAREMRPPGSKRRIVVATNIAETSLTIDGITFVVDSGLICQPEWDVATVTETFPSVPHSQQGLRQRWGRVGRTAPGWVFPLYSREQFLQLPLRTPPEATRADLEQFVLTAKAAGVSDVTAFVWPASFETRRVPSDVSDEQHRQTFRAELERATAALGVRGALDATGDLTLLGQELQAFRGSAAEATAMMLADQLACAVEMATVLPLLLEAPILPPVAGTRDSVLQGALASDAAERHARRRSHQALLAGCRDDVDLALKLFAAWEAAGTDNGRWCAGNHIDVQLLRDAAIAREKLLAPLSSAMKTAAVRTVRPELAPRIRAILTVAFADQAFALRGTTWTPTSATVENVPVVLERAQRFATDRIISMRRDTYKGAIRLANIVVPVPWAESPKWIPLAASAARHLRVGGRVAGSSLLDHLAYVDEFPIGAYIRCSRKQGSGSTSVVKVIETQRPHLALQNRPKRGRAFEDVAPLRERHGDVTPLTGAVTPAEEDDVPVDEEDNSVVDALADATPDVTSRNAIRREATKRPPEVTVRCVDGSSLGSESWLRVIGYEGLGSTRTILVVPGPDVQGRQRAASYRAGDVIRVHADEVVTDAGEPFLVAHDVASGAEVVLGGTELTFDRFDRSIAATIPLGCEFEVTVVRPESAAESLRVTRIPQVEASLDAAKPTAGSNGYAARITEDATETGWATLTLVHGHPKTGLVHRFRVRRESLSHWGIPVVRDLVVDVTLGWEGEREIEIDSPPPGLTELCRVSPDLKWDADRDTLVVKRVPLGDDVVAALLRLTPAPQWRNQVNALSRSSKLRTVVGASVAIDQKLRGRVVKTFAGGALVDIGASQWVRLDQRGRRFVIGEQVVVTVVGMGRDAVGKPRVEVRLH